MDPAFIPRTVTRGKLRGAAGLRHGLGWCVIPPENRAKLACTKCGKPPAEGWLVVTDRSTGQTAIEVRCSGHSPWREAVRDSPKETRIANERLEKRKRDNERALAKQQTNTFISYLTVPGNGLHHVVAGIVRAWTEQYGHEAHVKRAAQLNASVTTWLDSLSEAERVLAVVGREQVK